MTTKQRFILSNAEEVSHGLKCAANILEAIHMTMEDSESPQTYLDALYGLWDYLIYLHDKLQETINDIYTEQEEN